MVDHYPLIEFAWSKIILLQKIMFKAIIIALCDVALASPPRHQHLRCFHYNGTTVVYMHCTYTTLMHKTLLYRIIMPRCACTSEVYGSVFVCVCVCVCVCRPLQLLKDESSASKSFYRLLVMFTWILIRGFAK